MPTYTSSNTSAVYSGEPYFRIVPGDNVTDQYIRDLPTGVTLKSHEPTVSPWVLLVSSSVFPTESTDVSAYKSLLIHNECGESISVEANGDTENAIRFGPNVQTTVENDPPLIGSIIIDTDGSGDVYVWGLK